MSLLVCGYQSHILKEDYDQGMVWDNEPVCVIMNRIWREAMIKKGLRTEEEYEMQERPTEEVPIVEPDQSSDFDKTEEVPIVGKVVWKQDIVNPPKANGGLFYKMVNRIRDSIIAFKNRRNPQLPEGHDGKQGDKSDYYAQIAAMRAAGRQTFDERYAVKPEDLAPLKFGDKPKDQTIIRKDEERY